MLKQKLYKFGISLAKGQEVLIKKEVGKTYERYLAIPDESRPVQLGVDRKDFTYKDEPDQYKIDSDRVSQYEGERVVDTVTLLEEPKKGAKKVLVYSPKLQANVLVYRKDLKLI